MLPPCTHTLTTLHVLAPLALFLLLHFCWCPHVPPALMNDGLVQRLEGGAMTGHSHQDGQAKESSVVLSVGAP